MRKQIETLPSLIEKKKKTIAQMQTDKQSADKLRDSETGKVKEFALVKPMGSPMRKHEDINAFLYGQIQKRLERPFDEIPSFKIGDFTVAVQTKPGHMDEAVLMVKGVRESVYYIQVGSSEKADNWQRIANFLDSGIAKEIEKTEQDIQKHVTDLQQAKERVDEPFPLEDELRESQIKFAALEAELAGLSEQTDEIVDPDETDEEETDEERAEREAYEQRDEDDLTPDPPVKGRSMK